MAENISLEYEKFEGDIEQVQASYNKMMDVFNMYVKSVQAVQNENVGSAINEYVTSAAEFSNDFKKFQEVLDNYEKNMDIQKAEVNTTEVEAMKNASNLVEEA